MEDKQFQYTKGFLIKCAFTFVGMYYMLLDFFNMGNASNWYYLYIFPGKKKNTKKK